MGREIKKGKEEEKDNHKELKNEDNYELRRGDWGWGWDWDRELKNVEIKRCEGISRKRLVK